MQNTQSLCIRLLLLITGGITQCLAVKQITVMKGDTLTLTCPLKNTNMSDHVEWRNSDGFVMFFNRHKALKDKRIMAVTLTESEYTIRVSDVTFKDGGVYKCLHYNDQVSTKRYKVIVISAPKLEKDEQEHKTIVKCSATANINPPRLSWLLENGLEIETHPYYEWNNVSKEYTAVSNLHVKTHARRATLKCLVHHSALHGSRLENFIHIGNQGQDTSPTSEYSSNTLGTTETIPTLAPSFSNTINETPGSISETTEGTPSNASTNSSSYTPVNETTESIYETTEGTPSNASTNSSSTPDYENRHVDTRSSERGNSVLLVLLVTCLIICLFVVLAFFLVRLRKAHVAWKKENEESDQSVESSKSKSSNEKEQKQTQQQKRQGFWNTSFTKYNVEETLENDARTTPASVQVINETPQHLGHSISGIKETDL